MTAQIKPDMCEDTRRTPDVRPYLHPFAKKLLENRGKLFQMKGLHNGPVHVIFPHVMRENIQKMQKKFEQYNFQTDIYYTCKPNKSRVFLKEAFDAGIKVDVSSAQELITALGVGFRGQDIGCTNIKNSDYVRLSVEHGCLISVDNIDELQSIKSIHDVARNKDKCRIMLRVSDLKPKDRQMIYKASKFGIAESALPRAMEYILSSNDVFDFYGLHFHHDNPIADVHAGYIEHALTLMEKFETEYNIPSRLIDIGGGLRVANIESDEEWSNYIGHISQGLTDNEDTGTWNNQAYGMKLGEKNRVNGRTRLESKGKTKNYTTFLKDVLENTDLREHPIHRVISDNLLSLMVEPGASLLGHAGFTMMRVNGTKQSLAKCDNGVFVDGNIYNISSQFMESVTDFILIPQNVDQNSDSYGAFIIDNLCNESGLLSQKRMYFSQKPKEGDLIIIPNTAAYLSDFQDTSPHMHPQGKKIVATPTDGDDVAFYDEEYYSQFGPKL